jgi:hypothetical protein
MNVINKLRNAIVNTIIRVRMVIMPLDPQTNDYQPPFRNQKVAISRQLHKFLRWLTPKSDYEADLARSIELHQQQRAQRLKLRETTADVSEPKIFDAFIADECLKHFEDDLELQSQRIDKNTFRMSPPLDKPLYVETKMPTRAGKSDY